MTETKMKEEKAAAFAEIEYLAEALAETDAALAAAVADCTSEVRAVQAGHADAIRARAEALAAARDDLIRVVDANRALFGKPKSRTVAGVKLGLRKGHDMLDLGNEPQLIARIKSLLPEQLGALVRQRVEIVKSALKALPAETLQRLGVRYVRGADEAFATMDKSDAERQAEAILASAASIEGGA